MTGNPTTSDHNIRAAVINVRTKKVYNASGKKTVGVFGKLLPKKRMTMVCKQTSGYATRLFDVAKTAKGDTVIALAKWKDKNDPAAYYVKRGGSLIPICRSERFWNTYFGGITFINADTILVCYGQDGCDHLVRMVYDAEQNTYAVVQEYDSQEYDLSGDPAADYNSRMPFRMMRPTVDPSGTRFMYQKGNFHRTNFRIFNTGVWLSYV